MTRDGFHVESMPATEEELALARETMRSGVPRLAVHLAASAFWPRGASELCAVVRYGSRSAGVLRVLGPTPDAFDLQDLDLLTILARQAGAAVETSRLFTLQDFQRQRAEGAAELAWVTLQAMNVADGATELLNVLDRFVPSIGKAIGLSRARDGVMEYVAVSGTLDVLRGRRPVSAKGIVGICPDGRRRELPRWRAIAPADVDGTLPDEWGFVVPLVARSRPTDSRRSGRAHARSRTGEIRVARIDGQHRRDADQCDGSQGRLSARAFTSRGRALGGHRRRTDDAVRVCRTGAIGRTSPRRRQNRHSRSRAEQGGSAD